MQYNLKGTGIDLSDELRSYIDTKLAQSDKFLAGDPVALASVELEHRPLRDGEHYRAECQLRTGTGTYRAESWGQTLHAAIDLMDAELRHKLRRTKHIRASLMRRGALRIKEFVRGWRSKI